MQLDHESEVDRNFEAFKKIVSSLMATHAGQYAVLRHGNLDACYNSAAEALKAAYKRFPDGLFSVQEVADRPLDLGFYSHVANIR